MKKRTLTFSAKLFFRKSEPKALLPDEEIQLLKRENEESRKHAMPDGVINNSFGDGSFVNNISRIQSTTNADGLSSVVERRIIEPRSGQTIGDQESL